MGSHSEIETLRGRVSGMRRAEPRAKKDIEQILSKKIDICRQTRKNIFDGIELEEIYYGGRLNDVDFLSRLYKLSDIPSADDRYSDASGDIWQHCINNYDWEKNWVFSDPRFGLMDCSDEDFLNFLCETVHPLVRPDQAEQVKLVGHINEQLQLDGWKLVEAERIAGRAKFNAQKIGSFRSNVDRAYTAADVLSSNWMQTEIRRIQDSVEKDPALAIGTSKDLVESCCKAILDQLDVPVTKTEDLPSLSKKMCKALKLVPEDIPSSARGANTIKILLSNLAAITKGLAELRGLYGSGHGRDGKHIGLEPRHARLAASSAIAFVDFATETYLKQKP